MVSYFRKNPRGYNYNTYFAVSDTPSNTPSFSTWKEHPVGEVRVNTTPTEHIPHWTNEDPKNSAFSGFYHDMAKETGMSPRYLHEISRITRNEAYDNRYANPEKSIAASKFANSLSLKKEETTPEEWEDAVKTVNSHPLANPETLFTTKQGAVHIDEAYFDPSMRYTFPTVAGVIKQDYPHHQIIPSQDLSEHSAKLVKHAARAGLLGDDIREESVAQTNTIDFQNRTLPANYILEMRVENKQIPTSEVASARQGLREMLRGNKPTRKPQGMSNDPRISTQFEQLKLFEQ